MSKPVRRDELVDYQPRGNLYVRQDSPQNKRITETAANSFQPTERAYPPFKITNPPNNEKIAPTYERRIGSRNKNGSLVPSHSHRIENTSPAGIKTPKHENRQKKLDRPVRENPPQSFFRFAYLFFAGICALIGAILYGLFKSFSSQPTDSPVTIGKEQQDPLLPFIGNRKPNLAYLANNYNADFMKNLNSLENEHSITGVRPIRGDGNCYYRAILFGLLEQVIQKNPEERKARLEHIAQVFNQIKPQMEAHKQFIEYLKQAANGSIWNSIEELEAAFLDEDFNSAMLRSARDLLADWTRRNVGTQFNGLTLEDSITTGYGTVEEFISEYISPEGSCAEGPPIDLGGLGIALGFKIVTYVLPSTKNSTISINETLSSKAANEEVHLVLRPGHYDLLYRKQQSEDPELERAIKASEKYVIDKNIYGSRGLDSIKDRLMGFENLQEPSVPLSEEVAAQIDILKTNYDISRWRPIAGDGDCYYRANMFGLIERIIRHGKRQRFNHLAEIFEKITPSLPQAYKTTHENFVAGLKAAAAGHLWCTLDSFKQDVVDLRTGLDKAMVRAARYLVATEIENMASRPPNEDGLTIEQFIGEQPLEDYCRQIRTMGSYAEGAHVNMSILSGALGFPLTLYTADREGLFMLEQARGDKNEKVSILLIPERVHYVLVYPKSFFEAKEKKADPKP